MAVSLPIRTGTKIANGLAKVNYIYKIIDFTVKRKVVSWARIHRVSAVRSHERLRSISIMVAILVISLLTINAGYVSTATTISSSFPSRPFLNVISASSPEQNSQQYQTPLLTLETDPGPFSTDGSTEMLSTSSLSSTSAPSPSTISTGSVTSPPSSPSSSTTPPSTDTPSTPPSTPQPAPTPPPATTTPMPPVNQQQQPIYQQPAVPQLPSTIQQQPAQPLIQTTPQGQSLIQTNPAQPFGVPSTSSTIQPQISTLPPSATTFPPSVYPPVSSLQPYGTTGTGTLGAQGYPSTTAGLYGSGTGIGATSVGTSSQIISPWFPSLPATYCGGTFLLTIEGTPRGNDNQDNKIEPSDNKDDKNGDDNDDNNHKDTNSKNKDKDRRLLSLQINSDNTRIFTDENAIFGEIFLGKKNIDQNKGNDFDIKSIFNDCQIVTYSKF